MIAVILESDAGPIERYTREVSPPDNVEDGPQTVGEALDAVIAEATERGMTGITRVSMEQIVPFRQFASD